MLWYTANYPEMIAHIKKWWAISEISQQLEVKESFPISPRWSTQKQDHPSSLSRSTTDSQTICFVASENSNSEIKAIVYGRIERHGIGLLMKIAKLSLPACFQLVWSSFVVPFFITHLVHYFTTLVPLTQKLFSTSYLTKTKMFQLNFTALSPPTHHNPDDESTEDKLAFTH